MNIVFPQTPLRLREREPIEILVTVNGKRVTVRVDWSAAASLSGGDSADAIRQYFQPRRHEVERAITAHLKKDARLAEAIKARPGLRVPGAWDPFELAVRAVLGQQITVGAARKLAGKLVALCGEPMPQTSHSVAGLTHTFPSAAQVAAADLSGLGMPGARIRTLSAVAKAAVAERDLFSTAIDLESAVERLCALPGIGEWTAQYIALRALHEPDAFPASDVGLLRAMDGFLGKRATAEELLDIAKAWRPWRAYAAQHLWTADAAQPLQRKKAA